MIASLAADKAAAQSCAAELETRIARDHSDHRRRAERSRRANAVAADRLSVAESRARAAEARVETLVRRLTLGESRLREVKRRAADSARGEAKESKAAAEAPSAKGGEINDVGHQNTAGGGLLRDVPYAGHEATGRSAAQRGQSCFTRRPSEMEQERHGIQLSPSPSGSAKYHHKDRPLGGVVNGKHSTRRAVGIGGETQHHGDTTAVALQENRDPAGGLTAAFGFETLDNEVTGSILLELEASRQQVAVAEQQAAASRLDANRVKAEAEKTATDAEAGKERAMVESEWLARELKATGNEVWRTGVRADPAWPF